MTTAFEFACPSCAAPGRAQVDWAGRSVRCKHCKAIFTLPSPGEAASAAYDLADPVALAPDPTPAPFGTSLGGGGTTFTRSYRDAPLPDVPPERPRSRKRRERTPREDLRAASEDRRVRVLAGLAIGGAVLAVLAFAIPGFGAIGGWILSGIGLLLIAVGFFAGAYAAFSEDLLYGFAYVVFPIYTGYYLVTRFDDLWPWFSASTIGFAMFLLGTKALEVSGAF